MAYWVLSPHVRAVKSSKEDPHLLKKYLLVQKELGTGKISNPLRQSKCHIKLLTRKFLLWNNIENVLTDIV